MTVATQNSPEDRGPWCEPDVEAALGVHGLGRARLAAETLAQRSEHLRELARLLREQADTLARVISTEMGKPLREARAEVAKCVLGCTWFADHGPALLGPETIQRDRALIRITRAPLGTVLAIMPWNFPFWQVVRCAAPAMMAGNGVLLKHASIVPRCAATIESLFRDAGFPEGAFLWLRVGADQIKRLILDPRISAVSLTGSEAAGRSVAAMAGRALKKVVLELGGSDPFIVLEDADLDYAARAAITGRFQNTGQSCIAAKRLILSESIAEDFLSRFLPLVAGLRSGDPLSEDTDIGPVARRDLRDTLHEQVRDAIGAGARLLAGGLLPPGSGSFYPPTVLDHVRPGMRAFDEETFGPLAVVARARDEADAIHLANATHFGLGASLWTKDRARAERLIPHIAAGQVFVNAIVHSDPSLPFGGIKNSGFGRELGAAGLAEFVNLRTEWIDSGV